MDARQNDAIDVEQRLYPRRVILLEQFPLRRSKPELVVAVMARHTANRDIFEFLMLRCRVDDQRGIELLEYVAIPLEQHREELQRIMGDQVHFNSFAHS